MTGTVSPVEEGRRDTRRLLLEAAADLISAAPGEDVSLRAICERVGVKLPTLYHFFGSKKGLLDAVIEHGFDLYLDVKRARESSGDPIQDIRDGWDAHVDFGLANPAFYALMYGQITPGHRPAAQNRPTAFLLGLTREAHTRGRLSVTPERAADHILAANIGVTLTLITAPHPDMSLSTDMREATINAITTPRPTTPTTSPIATAAHALLNAIENSNIGLDKPESHLLKKWLTFLSQPPTQPPPSKNTPERPHQRPLPSDLENGL